MNFIEFEIEDKIENSKSEKLLIHAENRKQLKYEEFHRYCLRGIKSFHTTARKMESFNDNSNIEQYEPFENFYPRYNDMNMDQMKSYFIWRTKVRNGFVEPISTSYIFVYIYELLHLVGVKSAEIGFSKLIFLWENAVGFEPIINQYLKPWLIDFVEYYDLHASYLEHPMLKTAIDASESDIDKLAKALSLRDYHVISDIIARKGYNYYRGAISRHAEVSTLEQLITKLLQTIMENNDFISHYLIGTCRLTLELFARAVFEPYRKTKYYGKEKIVRHLNTQYMTELGRTIEIALDEIFGIPQRLMDRKLLVLKEKDAAFIKRELKKDVITNKIVLLQKIMPPKKNYTVSKINTALANKNEMMETPRMVDIDINSLAEIREKADSLAERLIPEDLLKEYTGEPKLEIVINNSAFTDDKDNPPSNWAAFIKRLDNHGKNILALISARSSYIDISRYAVGNHLMLEEEIEKINNLAIEVIGDTIIEGNEKRFLIYEEYSADLAILKLSN